MTGSHIRHEIVELLVGHHGALSDFSARPWKLVHENGELFTPQESALANSASLEELATAQQLAAASHDHYARKRRDLARIMELLGLVPGWEDLLIVDTVTRLPAPEQEEAIALLCRYTLADLQG